MITGRVLGLSIPALVLTLSGCAVGDGVAHVVKLINGKPAADQGAATAPGAATTAAAPSTAGPMDSDLPPAPAAVPRDDIKVEELAPPK